MPNNTIISDFLTGKVCFDGTVKRIEDLIIKKIKEDIFWAERRLKWRRRQT